MRSAVSRFTECISICRLPLPEKIKKSLLETLNENTRHPNSQIQVQNSSTKINFVVFFLFLLVLKVS